MVWDWVAHTAPEAPDALTDVHRRTFGGEEAAVADLLERQDVQDALADARKEGVNLAEMSMREKVLYAGVRITDAETAKKVVDDAEVRKLGVAKMEQQIQEMVKADKSAERLAKDLAGRAALRRRWDLAMRQRRIDDTNKAKANCRAARKP